MRTQHLDSIRLMQGQAIHFHARRGTRIAARQGSIRLLPAPLWIGEQMVQESVVLCESEEHRVQQSGMITIQARSDAEVLGIEEESRLRMMVAGWYAFIAARAWRKRVLTFLSARTRFR